MDVKSVGSKYNKYLIDMRRYFHMHPETANCEFETSKRIKQELNKIGVESEIVADTGVVGNIICGKAGKTAALRADIDALAVTEKTNLEFASINKGIMHACGHDTHIAMLLTACKILNDFKKDLCGKIRIIFEPAEETAEGAKKMIAAGAMKGVDTVFGIHVLSAIPAGKISTQAGSRMASADFFDINIKGKTCHGGKPAEGIDSIVAASSLVMNLQTIVSREIDAAHPSVLTVGEFKAGERNNVVAGEAFLSGTTRAFDNETREYINKRVEEMALTTAKMFRTEVHCKWLQGAAPVINEKNASERATKAAIEVMGEDAIYNFPATLLGDNFAEYIRCTSGCYAFLGVRNPSKAETQYPQHSCYYNVDEDVLIKGAEIEAQFIIDFCAEQNEQ